MKLLKKELEPVVDLIRPLVTQSDFRSLTDSIYIESKDNVLTIRAIGEISSIKFTKPNINDEFKILTDAIKFIHVVNTNTKDLELTISGKNIESGLGTLTIKGNNVSTLPLKNIKSYPEFDSTEGEYTEINESFLKEFILASNFVDKNSQNHKSGVCVTKERLIATDGSSGIMIRNGLDITLSTIPTTALKSLSRLENLSVYKKENNSLMFKGTIGEFEVYLVCNTIDDPYPFDSIQSSIKNWIKMGSYQFSIKKDELSSAVKRIMGFTSSGYNKIKLTLKKNSLNIYFNSNNYETDETIECIYEDTDFSFCVNQSILEEIQKVSSDLISISILKDTAPVLYIKENNFIYFGTIFKE